MATAVACPVWGEIAFADAILCTPQIQATGDKRPIYTIIVIPIRENLAAGEGEMDQ